MSPHCIATALGIVAMFGVVGMAVGLGVMGIAAVRAFDRHTDKHGGL